MPPLPLQDNDAYSSGGTVEKLEEAAAALLGKEAALWCPTGTMANLLGVFALTSHDAPRVILPAESHIYHDTGDGVSRLLSLQPVPIGAGKVCYSADEAAAAIQDGQIGGRVKSAVGCDFRSLFGPFHDRGADFGCKIAVRWSLRAPSGGGRGRSCPWRR